MPSRQRPDCPTFTVEDTLKHPWFTKLAALAAVVLLLLFGLGLIEDVVQGRQHYRSMTAQAWPTAWPDRRR